MSNDARAQEAIILLAFGPCVVIVIVGTGYTLGRAPRTKETLPIFVRGVELPDIHEYSAG